MYFEIFHQLLLIQAVAKCLIFSRRCWVRPPAKQNNIQDYEIWIFFLLVCNSVHLLLWFTQTRLGSGSWRTTTHLWIGPVSTTYRKLYHSPRHPPPRKWTPIKC